MRDAVLVRMSALVSNCLSCANTAATALQSVLWTVKSFHQNAKEQRAPMAADNVEHALSAQRASPARWRRP